MKQSILMLAMLLLVGAGCSGTEPTANTTNTLPEPAVKEAGTTDMADPTETDTMPMAGDIELNAESNSDGEVSFDWELPEGTEYDGFILVRGEEPNPEHTGKNYWFRQHYTRRAVTWTPVPTGEWHFRICGLKGTTCDVYSNNVTVTVR